MARATSVRPAPDQPAQAHHFTLPDGEVDVAEDPLAVQPLDLQHHLARIDLILRVEFGDRAPHHQADDVLGSGLFDGQLAGELPVAQHHHPVGDGHDLVDAVRDEDDRHAAFLQAADQVEEPLDLLFRQRSRRLVHDQDVGAERQGLGDLHELLLGNRQLLDRGARVDGDAQVLQLGQGAVALGPPVDQAHLPQQAGQLRLPAQEDVLADGLVRCEVELLVDGADAHLLGVVRGAKGHRLPAQDDAALVVAVDAAQDLHQGGLARPVLAHQGHHLSPARPEVHLVQGLDARERLGDTRHLENRLAIVLRQTHPPLRAARVAAAPRKQKEARAAVPCRAVIGSLALASIWPLASTNPVAERVSAGIMRHLSHRAA